MYFTADIFKGIPLEDKSVDLFVADPPFNIKFDGRLGTYNRRKDRIQAYQEYMDGMAEKTAEESHRLLKEKGSAWIVMGWNHLRVWENAFKDVGFHQIGHVIWQYQFGVFTKIRPTTSHYHILVYTKHKKKWTYNKQKHYDEDIWYYKRKYKVGGIKYANHLPEELVERIIRTGSNEGDTVYDPFVGSGTTVRVANRINRDGIGSDILDNSVFWEMETY